MNNVKWIKKFIGRNVKFTFRENGAKVNRADLIFTLNGGKIYEEWHRASATLKNGNEVTAELPEARRTTT